MVIVRKGAVDTLRVMANGHTLLRGGWGQSPAPIDQPQADLDKMEIRVVP